MKNAYWTGTNQDSGILSTPLSFLRSGTFGWDYAGLYNRGGDGYYWSLRSASTAVSYYLYFHNTGLNPQYNYNRGYGFAVRCVSNTEWSGGLAPDSICPKGWQLPTYSGDKSFTTLINTSYSMKNNGETEEDNRDSGVLSVPLSFLRNGNLNNLNSVFGGRSDGGYYWFPRSSATSNSNAFAFHNTRLNLKDSSNRGVGFAVCRLNVPRQILHHSH